MPVNTIPLTPLTVAQVVQQPNPYRGNVGLWNRLDIARTIGRKKTRHVIDCIERSVSLGYIYKYYGHDGTRECWIYTTSEPML